MTIEKIFWAEAWDAKNIRSTLKIYINATNIRTYISNGRIQFNQRETGYPHIQRKTRYKCRNTFDWIIGKSTVIPPPPPPQTIISQFHFVVATDI